MLTARAISDSLPNPLTPAMALELMYVDIFASGQQKIVPVDFE